MRLGATLFTARARPARRRVLLASLLVSPLVLVSRLALAAPPPAQVAPAQVAPAQVAPAQVTSHLVEAGLVLALPAALSTGMTAGVDAAYAHGLCGWLAWGVRASWSAATEHAVSWTVRHDDLRLRAQGVLQRALGRGKLGLRLGVGATLVHELRTRSQGNRAGIEGAALETSAWSVLPAVELELIVVLRVVGAWGVAVSGGPSVHLTGNAARLGWTGALGIAWQR